MSEDKGNGKLVKIGGALIILAAFGIMLPAIFQYVAGIGRMVILVVVALGFAYLLNMMMARQALERVRRAKAAAAAAGSAAGGSGSTAGGSSNAAGGSSSAAGGSSNAEGGSGNAGANSNHSQETNGKSGGGDSNETAEKN